MPRNARAQVYVTHFSIVSEYDATTGGVINASFITGLTELGGVSGHSNRPLVVEIKGFKTSHSLGVKTALIVPITAGSVGNAECPESGPANNDITD